MPAWRTAHFPASFFIVAFCFRIGLFSLPDRFRNRLFYFGVAHASIGRMPQLRNPGASLALGGDRLFDCRTTQAPSGADMLEIVVVVVKFGHGGIPCLLAGSRRLAFFKVVRMVPQQRLEA